MLDSLLEIVTGHKETIKVSTGEMFVSQDDGAITSENDVILSPGQRVTLSFNDKLLKRFPKEPWKLTVRSGLAQAGLTTARISLEGKGPEVEILNLHPRNDYLIPKGATRLGRLYMHDQVSLSGALLDYVISEILSADNTFPSSEGIRKVSEEMIEIPFVDDYSLKPGVFDKGGPINIQELSSGVERWKIKQELGTNRVISQSDVDVNLSNPGLRLLVTPYFTVPQGVALVIQNSDSLESRVIDPGFKHMIVGEFHDAILKDGEKRTQNSLQLKAYKLV